MEVFDIAINQLPAKTWNHLHMNESKVAGMQALHPYAPAASGAICRGTATALPFSAISGGSGAALEQLFPVDAPQPEQYCTPASSEPEPLRLAFDYSNGAAAGSRLWLEAGENSVFTIFMDFTSPQNAQGVAAVQTRLLIHKNACIRLVQVQRLGNAFTLINDIGANCEENASIELVQLVLSGKGNYNGCSIALTGENSRSQAALAYSVQESETLDINYVARHIGRKTESALYAAGSLREQGAKLFRGTIDFAKGCAGSIGNEKEEVLLMNDGTVNQTIPLILCAEEAVEGNHGASIGRPDEEMLFYLASRGIPQPAAYNLLAQAKLEAVAGKIQNNALRQDVLRLIQGGEQHA